MRQMLSGPVSSGAFDCMSTSEHSTAQHSTTQHMSVYDEGNNCNNWSVSPMPAVISDRPVVNGMGERFTFMKNTETGKRIDPA